VTRVRFMVNTDARRDAYSVDEAEIIALESAARALKELSTWPGYGVSPLWNLPRTAHRLGVASVMCKDETRRFGLGSFKALGGAYAAGFALKRHKPTGGPATLCCATDGNHGQSVAYGARRHGCRCVVFVHEHAPESKVMAMRALGAEVSRVAGNYDDSVRYAKRIAAEQGWLLISDTSDLVSDAVAAEVMQGYGVMALEILEQLDGNLPTHVFLQAGVGGLAAAIAGCFAQSAVSARPRAIVVEPNSAACVMQNAIAQGPSHAVGDLATNMAMLSCGEASAPAWLILSHRADAFMTVSDDDADESACWLGKTPDVPGGIKTTPSGAAGLAGAIVARGDPESTARLELDKDSRVLIFVTESSDGAAGTAG
jgi:diaminopropionate ammonia-lyase